MKRFNMRIVALITTIFITAGISISSAAASLDFGWSTPVVLANKEKKNVRETYIAWPIQISNSTKQKLVPALDIVAVTNTGKQYSPIPELKVSHQEGREMLSLTELKGNIFPSVTRRAMAIFKNIDPKATIVHFYIGGLDGRGRVDREDIKYLRVTYKRLRTGWELESTDVIE